MIIHEVKNLLEDLAENKSPSFLKFGAQWCSPCRMIEPFVKELSVEYDDVLFYDIDVDENPLMAEYFQIQNIPTFVGIKESKEIDRVIGAQPRKTLQELLDKTKEG